MNIPGTTVEVVLLLTKLNEVGETWSLHHSIGKVEFLYDFVCMVDGSRIPLWWKSIFLKSRLSTRAEYIY